MTRGRDRKTTLNRPSLAGVFSLKFDLDAGGRFWDTPPDLFSREDPEMKRFLMLAAIVGGFTAALTVCQTASAEGWSLWPKKSPESQAPSQKQAPSGVSKFFADVKDTVTFNKKSPPPQRPVNPYAVKQKEKGWFEKVFGPAEPEKKQTPSEWISQKRPSF